MCASLVAGTRKELLPFPPLRTAVPRAEAGFGFVVSEALPGGQGLQAPLAVGGGLPQSPGPCGRSLSFPGPPARPRLERPLRGPAPEPTGASGRVEGQGFLPGSAGGWNLEPDPQPESRSVAAIRVPAELRLCSRWLPISAQTVATSQATGLKRGDLAVLLRGQETSGDATRVQGGVHQQHGLEAIERHRNLNVGQRDPHLTNI